MGEQNPLSLIPNTDPRLHQVCEPVGKINGTIVTLAHDMLKVMYANGGCGLAAPQVGHNIRLIVMDCTQDKKNPIVMVNPVVLTTNPPFGSNPEGCLSYPGVSYRVKRSLNMKIGFTTLDEDRKEADIGGQWAICFQHEVDHLDGITMDQRGEIFQS